MGQAGLCQRSPFLPPHAWDAATRFGFPAQTPILFVLQEHCQIQTRTGADA